jgi:signal transduction histidine kinase
MQTQFEEGFTIESLMEALFYRDEFLALASHELKTPVTALRLHSQVFQRQRRRGESCDPQRVERLLEEVDRQTLRLGRLINDMLDISRIRSGKLVLVRESFSLSLLMRDCLEQQQEHFKPEQVNYFIEEDLWYFGDRMRIGQVISNILNNAARYGEGKPVEVKLQQRKNKTMLVISDQGRGIRPEDQKRIFHRFQRAIPAREVSGLGLGLYIAKSIVDAHGGKISLKSEVGHGSQFTVEFPKQVL